MCSFAASALVGLLKKCRTWDFDISDMIPDEKLLDEYEQEIEPVSYTHLLRQFSRVSHSDGLD